MRKIISLIVAVAFGPQMVAAAVLRPVDVSQFCVTPGESVKLQWRIEQGELAGSAEYIVRDYWGRRVAAGKAEATESGLLEATLELKPGFFDVEFPAVKQRFGLISLPACSAIRGPASLAAGGPAS
ncbi:MAG: hypothetical protein HQ567_22585, partial [Candidatus Nealsonbacteria bacterium]|nr:hypothetical protein [Candidatus Nealsonbacteria bacterium]